MSASNLDLCQVKKWPAVYYLKMIHLKKNNDSFFYSLMGSTNVEVSQADENFILVLYRGTLVLHVVIATLENSF